MRVVVLGGGYAGVVVADRLGDRLPADVDLVVVDETGQHLVQHQLHRAIRRPEFADVIEIPLSDILDRARVLVETVESVDRDGRRVSFESGSTLDYDVAAVCLGAETAFYGLPGVEEHGVPLKRLEDAAEIRSQFEDLVAAGGGTAVVGGAGLSGVQTAGELAAFAREENADIEVVLLEALDDVAPSFPQQFRDAVRRELEREGVDVRTDVAVERVTERVVETDGDDVASDVFVWTGGVRGPDALDGERVDVRADLAVDDRTVDDRAVVVGDAARVVDAEGTAVPASAQTAVREAAVAARNVERIVADVRERDDGFRPRLDRYTFVSPGWLVTVGDGAVAQVGPTVVRGTAANAVKSGFDTAYLASASSIRDAVGVLREEFELASHARSGRR